MDPFYDPFNPQTYAGTPPTGAFQPDLTIPALIAKGLSMKGITPEQFTQNPTGAVSAIAPQAADLGAPPSLGASLAGGAGGAMPNTLPAAPDVGAGVAGAAGGAPPPSGIGARLAETLKGVKAPPPPVGTTPHPVALPAGHAIKGGNIQALLQLLGAAHGQVPQVPLPLGQVLGR